MMVKSIINSECKSKVIYNTFVMLMVMTLENIFTVISKYNISYIDILILFSYFTEGSFEYYLTDYI
jgi:hypothetical protein